MKDNNLDALPQSGSSSIIQYWIASLNCGSWTDLHLESRLKKKDITDSLKFIKKKYYANGIEDLGKHFVSYYELLIS